MMELQPIVDEMRQKALDCVLDPIAGQPPNQDCIRDITFRSYKIRLTFTLDNLQTRKIWHLSIGPTAAYQVPNGIVNTILEAFMPGQRVEIPSVLHPGYVRQFIQPYEEE